MGGGREGAQLAKVLDQWLKGLIPRVEEDQVEGQSSGEWVYKAGRQLPENLIPFVPVAQQAEEGPLIGKRQVILQRAALPRVLADIPPIRIRPRTSLLGARRQAETEKLPPLFIFEEEVPRAGSLLQLVWKRTRWFDGSTKVWLSRKKTNGRGEATIPFPFDTLENKSS